MLLVFQVYLIQDLAVTVKKRKKIKIQFENTIKRTKILIKHSYKRWKNNNSQVICKIWLSSRQMLKAVLKPAHFYLLPHCDQYFTSQTVLFKEDEEM